MVKFVIISRQRSGSGLLRTYLKSHPQLNCIQAELPFMNEEHYRKYVDWTVIKKHLKPNFYTKKACQDGRIVEIQKKLFNYDKKHFPVIFYQALPENTGFDVKYDFISPETDFEELIIIHLVRKNTFEQAISKWIENNQSLSHRPTRLTINDYQSYNQQQKFTVKQSDIKRMIVRMKQQKQEWCELLNRSALKSRVLTLYYEDICDPTQMAGQVAHLPEPIGRLLCSFLQIDYFPMTSERVKVNPRNYQDYITNWSSLKKLRRLA